jgi:hypothetical protein
MFESGLLPKSFDYGRQDHNKLLAKKGKILYKYPIKACF